MGFKLGDKIRRTVKGEGGRSVGEEGIVVGFFANGRAMTYRNNAGIVGAAPIDSFELVSESDPIKAGDRAERVLNGAEQCPLGMIVDVLNVTKGQVWYIGKDGSELWSHIDNFKRVPPAFVQVETREVYSIIPGTYGRLRVTRDSTRTDQVYACITCRLPDSAPVPLVPVNADELDALAEQFTTLAKALRNAKA